MVKKLYRAVVLSLIVSIISSTPVLAEGLHTNDKSETNSIDRDAKDRVYDTVNSSLDKVISSGYVSYDDGKALLDYIYSHGSQGLLGDEEVKSLSSYVIRIYGKRGIELEEPMLPCYKWAQKWNGKDLVFYYGQNVNIVDENYNFTDKWELGTEDKGYWSGVHSYISSIRGKEYDLGKPDSYGCGPITMSMIINSSRLSAVPTLGVCQRLADRYHSSKKLIFKGDVYDGFGSTTMELYNLGVSYGLRGGVATLPDGKYSDDLATRKQQQMDFMKASLKDGKFIQVGVGNINFDYSKVEGRDFSQMTRQEFYDIATVYNGNNGRGKGILYDQCSHAICARGYVEEGGIVYTYIYDCGLPTMLGRKIKLEDLWHDIMEDTSISSIICYWNVNKYDNLK